ncbi:MAG: M15 family metallopeptidase [Thermoanaerobaculia bacterium]|nr:M15 family metallopeptidase [Thermoanaerobaculia bacterium]
MHNRFLTPEENSSFAISHSSPGAGRALDFHNRTNRFTTDSTVSRWSAAKSLSAAIKVPDLAVAAFSAAEKKNLLPFLPAAENTKALKWNTGEHPAKSGVSPGDIRSLLANYVDMALIESEIRKINAQNPSSPIDLSATDLNGVIVEAVHQFQQKCFALDKDHPKEQYHDGKAGKGTLNSLGIIPKNNNTTVNTKAKARLKAQGISTIISSVSVDHNNWFDFIVNPSILGWQSTNGIHYELAVRLRRAEKILLATPAFAGMTPVALGKALEITEMHRGFRPEADTMSFHTYGLAIDINYKANPFIGDPDKKSKQKIFWNIINKVAGPIKSRVQWEACGKPPVNINTYFHCLAENLKDTAPIVDALFDLNREFVAYLAKNPSDAASLRGADNYFNGRKPEDGFLKLHISLLKALREDVCLAWGAVDFGADASGDIMHFDMRIIPPFDRLTAEGNREYKAYWPKGIHPCQIKNGWTTVSQN